MNRRPTRRAAVTSKLANLVVRFRWPIIVGWILVAIVARIAAPRFEDVASDGDFGFLPAGMSSVEGGRLIEAAFPGERSRSQVVMVLARDTAMVPGDNIVALDLQRRLQHQLAIAAWKRLNRFEHAPKRAGGRSRSPGFDVDRLTKLITESLDRSIAADRKYYAKIANQIDEQTVVTGTFPRLAIAYYDRAMWRRQTGVDESLVSEDLDAARILVPDLESTTPPLADRPADGFESLIDVLSWDDSVIGGKLKTPSAKIALLQLSSELSATENIGTVQAVNRLIDAVMQTSAGFTDPGLQLRMTGSAAIGGETLMAAQDAIRYTETITVLTILLILVFVYRAPLLVFVPMASIGIAVVTAMALVCSLASWSANSNGVIPLRLFTTSRIFIVVILFGAGTDYCLFLISRLREESRLADWLAASRSSLSGVMGALIGSAMTTVVGLAMLGIAQFGKFASTGPVIAICLLTGLTVCLTFTPAVLSVLGNIAFWPSPPRSRDVIVKSVGVGGTEVGSQSRFWSWTALQLTRRPVLWLAIGVIGLVIPAWYGYVNETSVTYDLSSELDPGADSRQGLTLLRDHFNIGEINPVTLLIQRNRDVDRKQTEADIKQLATDLYAMPHVVAVRTADDPLGDFPPNREMGLLSGDGLKRRLLREHRTAQNYFFSPTETYANTLVRLDIAIDGDPFDIRTADTVNDLRDRIDDVIQSDSSDFRGSQMYMVGTTSSLIDLRTIITSDNRRIKWAVVIAVFLVLVGVIRRVGLCLYLIATVLLSYYATLGLTVAFFRRAYADDFVGLDWKLPVFLFVILVAIGQDYNVYLVTRIVEEERTRGWISAIRRAVSRTGGIITACGLVMAATFFSMTASGWMPDLLQMIGYDIAPSRSLRGIVELGFALGLGMIVDTLYVRTILVPSFIAATGSGFRGRRKDANTSHDKPLAGETPLASGVRQRDSS